MVVYDNCCTDDTAAQARAAGAEVYVEHRPGKGNVVRRMFSDIDADVYLMADGDGTYDAGSARRLVDMIVHDRLDMAIGARQDIEADAHRAGHAVGNQVFNSLYRRMFGTEFGDIFSGYRAFSRRFVKSFPALSSGFEIETELSVHATQLKLPTGEIVLPYGKRVEGSASKLRTFRDGWRILRTFLLLLKDNRPALFFGGAGSGPDNPGARPVGAAAAHVSRDRFRAPPADRDPVHGPCPPGLAARHVRADPRQRGARPRRAETHPVPGRGLPLPLTGKGAPRPKRAYSRARLTRSTPARPIARAEAAVRSITRPPT